MRTSEYKLIVERIPIKLFDSSHSLKREIRKIVEVREEDEWNLFCLSDAGSHIALHFKKMIMNRESAKATNAYA